MAEIKKLKCEQLEIDPRYQREPSKKKLKELFRNFDIECVGVLEVALIEGVYYVLDGNHRLIAMRRKSVKECTCNIHYGLTVEQAAEMFVLFNSKRYFPNAKVRFKALLAARDATAIKIKQIVESCGYTLRIPQYGNTNKFTSIAAIGALIDIYEDGHEETLRKTLETINAIWNREEEEAVHQRILYGIAGILKRYPDLNMKLFTNVMSKVSPLTIIRNGDGKSLGHFADRYAIAFMEVFNSHVSKSKQLEYRFAVNYPAFEGRSLKA